MESSLNNLYTIWLSESLNDVEALKKWFELMRNSQVGHFTTAQVGRSAWAWKWSVSIQRVY
ncbi:hypothetical protein J6590_062318 [Homalodisca vitripennis]|nr:hypothetical protein J6590_062318 [Homalodisca vitripennis]